MEGTALLTVLRALAHHGRYALVAGLLAGFLLPDLAARLKPWLPQLVVLLLFLTAIRIGPAGALKGLSNIRPTLFVVLTFQLALPLAALAVSHLLGVSHSPYVLALVLVLAAPALSGSPNLSIMLGADPEPAFRLLVLGTALLPITMLPVFWLLPQLGDLQSAIIGAARMLGAIGVAISLGFALRLFALPNPSKEQTEAFDGAMTVALFVIVIGLMAALRPAFEKSPSEVLGWMLLAFAVNIGMQFLTFLVLGRLGWDTEIVPFSIVSGNRNVAIFLVAMSPEAAEPLLIFLGCYQVPMYLTPILTRAFYRKV
ncbi:hypothetical protein SAMN05444273_10695 [Litoreibacter ascidiaceicola]|uniref:Bile acid:Na+ symporter, BASS family n=1 Tax=Litoreibacter ascidiaceicola TaxID=1486859 RepID=A0A1M5BQT4_9RHOB|nr:hypothetical protein [Litoreibacter ascidiaceicola]SHF44761.1 hypothetical protein SAMN05444273_10695 [Litoreibacter ascidiaceicola]